MPTDLKLVSTVEDNCVFESNLYTGNRDQSYNSWLYKEEASLYSIAEDSREDRATEVPSQPATSDYAASTVAMENTVDVSAANNLYGYIPEELCCMPCVETLSLAANPLEWGHTAVPAQKEC